MPPLGAPAKVPLDIFTLVLSLTSTTVFGPQVCTMLGPAGTYMPAGRLSVTAKLGATTAVELRKLMRRRERWPALITAGLKALLRVTLLLVCREALPDVELLVWPWSLTRVLCGMVFTTVPGLVLTTSSSIRQVVLAANVAPARATLVPPAAAVTTPPGQVVVALAGLATCMPLSAAPAVPSTVK